MNNEETKTHLETLSLRELVQRDRMSAPLISLCLVCKDRPITQKERGRPRVTCGAKCARVWASARARAARNKCKAQEALMLARAYLGKLQHTEARGLVRAAIQDLEEIKPGDLAVLPPEVPRFSEEQVRRSIAELVSSDS